MIGKPKSILDCRFVAEPAKRFYDTKFRYQPVDECRGLRWLVEESRCSSSNVPYSFTILTIVERSVCVVRTLKQTFTSVRNLKNRHYGIVEKNNIIASETIRAFDRYVDKCRPSALSTVRRTSYTPRTLIIGEKTFTLNVH